MNFHYFLDYTAERQAHTHSRIFSIPKSFHQANVVLPLNTRFSSKLQSGRGSVEKLVCSAFIVWCSQTWAQEESEVERYPLPVFVTHSWSCRALLLSTPPLSRSSQDLAARSSFATMMFSRQNHEILPKRPLPRSPRSLVAFLMHSLPLNLHFWSVSALLLIFSHFFCGCVC